MPVRFCTWQQLYEDAQHCTVACMPKLRGIQAMLFKINDYEVQMRDRIQMPQQSDIMLIQVQMHEPNAIKQHVDRPANPVNSSAKIGFVILCDLTLPTEAHQDKEYRHGSKSRSNVQTVLIVTFAYACVEASWHLSSWD